MVRCNKCREIVQPGDDYFLDLGTVICSECIDSYIMERYDWYDIADELGFSREVVPDDLEVCMVKMPEAINGKTPEEIKKDAETCLNHPPHMVCNYCKLFSECDGMAEHIIKELYDLVLQFESRLAQAERERDAAVADLNSVASCFSCKFYAEQMDTKSTCFACDIRTHSNFEWRGVCPENTKEDEE